MRKASIILAILLSISFCSISEANYINNPDFEINATNGSNNVDSWFTYNCVIDILAAFSGDYGLVCEPTETAGSMFVQQAEHFLSTFYYIEGNECLVSFYGKKDCATNSKCEAVICWKLDEQQSIYEDREISNLTTEWNYFEMAFAVPKRATDMYIAISFNTWQEKAMFDRVSLDVVPEPTSLAMLSVGALLLFFRK
ncbi:MAG: PEP-CTERM sorting domain-containing protein [Candidatus Omnitrophica bacterium]|nr:PEP-CTERM sorting domain-containing protein [Candidatus Omnitrophota bacterium]